MSPGQLRIFCELRAHVDIQPALRAQVVIPAWDSSIDRLVFTDNVHGRTRMY